MPEYSEQDLKSAARFREEIHREALARVRAVCPDADHVVDEYPADAYFQEVWDYPGKWYTTVGTPPGTGGRRDLTESIIRQTLGFYRDAGAVFSDEAFRRMIAEYPGIICDYRFVYADDRNAKSESVFPYRGAASHRPALKCAARELSREGGKLSFDTKTAKCRKISGKALFAPAGSDSRLNYRRAFLCSPRGKPYTDRDFERVNAVLFPGGAESLEVFRWTVDRSGAFDEGDGRRDALCLTVYDKTLERFVIITAQATD